MSDDEFGDSSFLHALDVDAIVAAAGAENRLKKSANGGVNPTQDKRRKLSVPPLSTIAAVPMSTTPHVIPFSASREAALASDKLFSTTLQQYFGYNEFRTGQLEVVQQVLVHRRDVAVFWATGQGKSLCYQIPALVPLDGESSHRIVVVVSPLISLMQDQVHKLNSLALSSTEGKSNQHPPQLATYLGSGQTDTSAEERALSGQVRLIYLTPEKLLGGNVLSRLDLLHQQCEIALVAIDEAHCVSEWGFDFRPEFRRVGAALRNHVNLQNIPILALTATAVPRVQRDICDSLQLRDPFVSRQSLDRSNLSIRVSRKQNMVESFKDLLSILNQPGIRASKQSTIVYAPTKSMVDEVTSYLQRNLQNTNETSPVRVEAYHAGLSSATRCDAHTRFLTGTTTVIVATVAFGMGIDKPDTRRVIHYGCPKTLEEYFQQIGRAGRDGLPAECTMYVAESDFDRYQSDFYLGGLTGPARQATEVSMAALRSYSFTSDVCRRKALLTYFEETPSFGDRCGTCDVCRNAAEYGSDARRDFGPLGARVLLQVINGLSDQGLTNIVKVVSGATIEGYRYRVGVNPEKMQQSIADGKKQLTKKYSSEYFRDLVSPLVEKGYLAMSMKTVKQSGFDRSWTVYNVTDLGRRALTQTLPILLPVPESVRRIEREAEKKRQQVLDRLQQNGIILDQLPAHEIESGDGPMIRAYSKWYAYLEGLKKADHRDHRLVQLESLINLVETWRSTTAVQERIAPASVLAEHMVYSVAYTVATLMPGCKLDADALTAAGVRSRTLDELVSGLDQWVDLVQPARATTLSSVGSPMVLTETEAGEGWHYAVYKPQKKTGLMVWEQSYVRFDKGESPQTIAMTPVNGRSPVQVKTVVGHVLDAVVYGRKVDLRRLVEFTTPPTKEEWDQLKTAERTTGMDVVGDPDTSGLNGGKLLMTDFLRPIVGDYIADLPFKERSESEQGEFTVWCDRLKWYMALRRAGYEPLFFDALQMS